MTDVLYIEDDDTQALLFQLGLSTRGINVLIIPDVTTDGRLILETPAYQAARALFVDLWIRTVSGIELARSLRAAGDIRPIFLVTAANNPNPSLLKQLDIGFLQKPLNFDQVAALIHSVTGE